MSDFEYGIRGPSGQVFDVTPGEQADISMMRKKARHLTKVWEQPYEIVSRRVGEWRGEIG